MSPAPHPPCRALIFGTSNSNCPNCRWALGPNFNAKDSDMQKYYNLQNMHIKPGNVEINWRLKRIFVNGFSQQPFLKALSVFIHFDEVLVFQQKYAWYTYKSASDLTWPTGHAKFVCVASCNRSLDTILHCQSVSCRKVWIYDSMILVTGLWKEY